MKVIGFPGKDLFLKSTPWLPARAQRSRLSRIGHSPEAPRGTAFSASDGEKVAAGRMR
jgi:hypothetical protein